MIRNLCKSCGTLTPIEINKVETIVETVRVLGNILNLDIFIDCPTKDSGKAMVVYHYRPENKSLYSENISGQFALEKNEPAVFRTLSTTLPSKNYKAITQEGESVLQNVLPIKTDDGAIVGAIIVEFSGEQNLLALKQLNVATKRIIRTIDDSKNNISDFMNDGIIVFDHKGIATYANRSAKEIYSCLGFSEMIVGEHFQNIVISKITYEEILKIKKVNIAEINISTRSISVSYFVTKVKKNKENIIMVIRDITKERNKEKELVYKSVAIKEIHHRVKNNLQTIASLLRIQKRRTMNDEVKKILTETISRILSIAITHEVLSENGLEKLDIKEIIGLILKNFSTTALDKSEKISFNIVGDSFNISSDKATAIALVINEIFQNIIDYAFPEKFQEKFLRVGTIDILIEKKMFYSTIIITDNGVGIEEKKIKKYGLGLTIVEKIIIEQLSGKFILESLVGKGTTIKIEMKNE